TVALSALSFLAGTIALLWLPAFPDTVVLGAIGLAGLASGALGWHLARVGAPDLVRFMARSAAVAAAGFLYAAWQAHDYLQHRWPEALTGERVLATAVVEGVPAVDVFGWSFDAVIEIEAPIPRRTLRVRAISRESEVRPRAGERWQLVLTLRPPRGRLNPGSI